MGRHPNENEEPLDALARLHREVDERTGRLNVIHADRLRCRRGCSGCCVDEITVYEVEADQIRRRHADLLDQGVPHPPGMCAFLDDQGACRIYEHRPYVCRTQGQPLRWIDDGPDGEPVEYRDICPLNEDGDPIEELAADACWTIGPVEERLTRLQILADAGARRRVRLRDLFDEGKSGDGGKGSG